MFVFGFSSCSCLASVRVRVHLSLGYFSQVYDQLVSTKVAYGCAAQKLNVVTQRDDPNNGCVGDQA